MIGAWWSWMLGVSLQAGLLLALVLALDLVLRRRGWIAVRVALWSALLLRFALPPEFGAPWSLSARVARTAELDWSAVAAAPTSAASGWIFAAWLAGVALVLARSLRARRRLAALVDSAAPAPRAVELEFAACARRMGLARVPELRVDPAFGGPAVVVLGARAIVVLPPSLLGDDAREEREHALLHELAHLARRDPLAARAVEFAQAFLWFHPAAWLARRRLAELRELGADARVARELGERASEYRASLLAAAERALLRPAPVGATAFVSTSSLLLLRLARLEHPIRRSPRVERAAGASAFAALALFVLPMACELPRVAGLDPVVQRALERLQRAVDADERQNCLEVQAAARVLQAHQMLTGEDLTARIH